MKGEKKRREKKRAQQIKVGKKKRWINKNHNRKRTMISTKRNDTKSSNDRNEYDYVKHS